MFEGKLIKDRYYHDVSDSGNYFDLAIIKRNVPGEDENGLIARIAALSETLEQRIDAHHRPVSKRMPTLFVTKSQYNAFSADHKKRLYAICYLMVADKAKQDWTYPLWDADGNDGLLWVSHNKVLSKWDGNALNHRFRVASLDEVNAEPGTQPVIPPVVPPVNPGDPPVVIGIGKYKITAIVTVEEVE